MNFGVLVVQEISIAFSAVGVDSRSLILGVNSTAAAVAGSVDINAMMGRHNYDVAADGPATPAVPAAASAKAKADKASC